jgi:hypothetical protein
VPSKYTVYHPFFDGSTPAANPSGFLGDLERRLSGAGTPVVNLSGAMSEGAARRIADHRYLYYRDDIHWNRRGTELAARTISSAISQSAACHTPAAAMASQTAAATRP